MWTWLERRGRPSGQGPYPKAPCETLNLLAIQQLFTEFYLGIARGALRTAAAYTRTHSRPWPYGGDKKASATEEWYILEAYGSLQSRLWAAEALADAVGAELPACSMPTATA